MPLAPPRPYSHPGCSEVTTSGRCARHAAEQAAKRRAGSACYSSHRWRAARKAYLAQHPSCAGCASKRPPVLRPAVHVDHKKPHGGEPVLFWDTAKNWQGLCGSCHSHKTASTDGGFGNDTHNQSGAGARA